MKNAVLVGILGAAFSVCLVASSVMNTATQVYLDAGNMISTLQATEPDTALMLDKETSLNEIVTAKGLFMGFSIEELAVGYENPYVRGNKTIINVPIINQYPELPTGCEITSITEVLNYIGFDVDKVYMQENFLATSYDFYHDEISGLLYGPDPRKVFVGDPKESGFGCFSPVVADALNSFFTSVESENVAIELFESDQAALEELLDNGIPVIVWASRNMKPFKYTAESEWIIEGETETFRWPGNFHVLVLTGYDGGGYYFADTDNREEMAYYQKSAFLTRWQQLGTQAVIIKQNEEKKK